MHEAFLEDVDLERSTSLQTREGSGLVGKGGDLNVLLTMSESFFLPLISATGPVGGTHCRCIQLDAFVPRASDTWIRKRPKNMRWTTCDTGDTIDYRTRELDLGTRWGFPGKYGKNDRVTHATTGTEEEARTWR